MDHMMGDPETLLAEYDAVDEKAEPAAVDEVELEPSADDHDAMRAQYLPLFPDLDVADEATSTWTVDRYRSLATKERGPNFTCGGHDWRILLFPAGNNVDYASLYLEQDRGDEQEGGKPAEGWAACVQFTLVLWNRNDPTIKVLLTAHHRFNAEESDWGFTRFAELRKLFHPSWEDKGRPMIENESVNITAYLRIYKDPTGVLWHNFFNYNSKKETGMIGLKNQGATCYLNSLLQSLFFTNAFRKAVYSIPTENETDRAKSAWALQRLFYQIQTSDDAVSTQELTQSFGWDTRQIFEQQDVQELSRILMERMEERMKGTDAENALAKMFVGKMKTYISCINVDYESSRIEDFWDIQLNVRGNKNLDESFKDYIQVETLDGENKYSAEGHGLQDAKKGVIFESFPQVLHLQLKRFEYDINRDAMMKVNDRYEFPEVFDASPYLSTTADNSETYIYNLHSVLVHSGDLNMGHYYAFLRPSAEGQFYRFDDDRVTRATNKEAMEENFGGDYGNKANGGLVRNPYTRTLSTKRSMSAYMLVYIRQSRAADILQPVSESDPPAHIARQLQEERAALEKKRKEREEQYLYLYAWVVSDANFKAHEGFDLTSWDPDNETPSRPRDYRILKASTITDLTKMVAESQKIPADQLRLWVMVNRQNKTLRPDQPIEDVNMSMEAAYARYSVRDRSFRLWAEQATLFENGVPFWPNVTPPNKNDPYILIFLKHFDAEAQTLTGVGHIYLRKQSKVSDMFPLILQKMGWADGATSTDKPLTNGSTTSPVALSLYEEIKSSMIEPMKPKSTLQAAEIQDGDIVCFQRQLPESRVSAIASTGAYTDAREFYDYLLNRKRVVFSPRFLTEEHEGIFTLDLSKRMSYEQFSAKVAEHLKVAPTHLRFSTVNATTGKVKTLVRRNVNQNLHQILTPSFGTYGNNNQRDDSLYYEILEMSLSELDTKKNLKVSWMTDGQAKEEIFDILVPKLGNIGDLIAGLIRKAEIKQEDIPFVRVYEISNAKLNREHRKETSVSNMSEYTNLIAEIIPEEERSPEDGEFLISCVHFDKEASKTHGIPFKFLVKPGEVFSSTKERLSKRIGIKGKQFEKIKFCIMTRSIYNKLLTVSDEDILSDMIRPQEESLGLDHVNRHRYLGTRTDSMFIR